MLMKERVREWVVFLVIIATLSIKLTYSPLWFDEGIEYWYSKILIGNTYGFATNASNMYQRICSTLQPPLYNVLMYLWLKMFDTEFGFRFFSVFTVSIGCIGIYKICKLYLNNIFSFLFSYFFATSKTVSYYAQECAEYCLLICSTCWLVYFYLLIIKQFTLKNYIYYLISCILAIYSQYGACFIILGTFIALGINLLRIYSIKSRQFLLYITIGFGCVIVLGIPLVRFFLLEQFHNAQNGLNHHPEFKNLFMIDFIHSWLSSCMMFFYIPKNKLIKILFATVILLVTLIGFYSATKKKCFFYYLIGLFFGYVFYYLSVKFKYYGCSYTEGFGNRWGIVFLPAIFVYYIIIFSTVLDNLLSYKHEKVKLSCFILLFLLIFMNLFIIARNHIKSGGRIAFDQCISRFSKVIILDKYLEPEIMFYKNHSNKESDIFIIKDYFNTETTEESFLENFKKEYCKIGDFKSFCYITELSNPSYNLEKCFEGLGIVIEGKHFYNPNVWLYELEKR